jgi:uncharacterized protein (DUF1697 family)
VSGHVALLRAVNVGGTGKLPMATLKALVEDSGFTGVRTYIASGNVVFDARGADEPTIKRVIEDRLEPVMGKRVAVLVRSAEEMAAVLAVNPFPDAPGNRVIATFLDAAAPADALDMVRHRTSEDIRLGTREIWIRYGDGMADSKLVIPAAAAGTGRNVNTVAKLAAMAAGI